MTADADSVGKAEPLLPRPGTSWRLPVVTGEGVVAVEQRGRRVETWDPAGASRLVAVDLETGARVELASSRGPITDVSVDATARHLLWVDREGLKWRVGDETARVGGDFVAAAWAG